MSPPGKASVTVSPLGRSRGFTLLELMATLLVAGVLIAVAVPGFAATLRQNRLLADAHQFLTALNLARSEAIKRGAPVSVRAIAGNGSNEWGGGWYLWLNEMTSGTFVGEKVLERPLTFAGQILFTTYTPSSNQSASFAPEQGVGRVYVLNATDGTPVIDRNPDHDGTDLSRLDRAQVLRKGGCRPA